LLILPHKINNIRNHKRQRKIGDVILTLSHFNLYHLY